jgi:hypothetical protein
MTAAELVYLHPLWTGFLFLVACAGLSIVARAIVEPLAPCRRGNCPRCNGTGGEERIRHDAKAVQP